MENLVEREQKSKSEIVSELSELFDRSKAVVGKKTWRREDLHER